MTVDNITKIGVQSPIQDKITETNKAKDAKQSKSASSAAAASYSKTGNVDFSPEAKKLQETEKILRFALEKLNKLDEIRDDKLSEVEEKIDSDFYFDNEIDKEISEKIFSNKDLQDKIKQRLDINDYLEDIKKFDEIEEPVDEEKLAGIRQKIDAGFYDNPDVVQKTAEALAEILS